MRLIPAAIATSALFMSSALSAASDAEARIADAFAQLGMPEEQSACYGRVIDSELGPEQSEQAASIVESADNSSDVRQGVTAAGGGIMEAFLAARNECGA